LLGWVIGGCWLDMWSAGQMYRLDEDDELEALGMLAAAILGILALLFVAVLAAVLWIGWS